MLFLNGGDALYSPKSLSALLRSASPEDDIVFGNTTVEYENGLRRPVQAGDAKRLWRGMVFSQQSSIVRRRLLLGKPFDTAYAIAADYKFYLNCHLNDAKMKRTNTTVAVSQYGGVSTKRRVASTRERLRVLREAGAPLRHRVFAYISLLHVLFRTLFERALGDEGFGRLARLRYGRSRG